MYGWNGKLLRIDLDRHTVSSEDVDPKIAKDFIGGRGWAIRYLYDEVDPTVDALDAGNKLILSTGPLTGTPATTGNRYMVITKSPLTGAISCSNSGGTFPTEMKRTGFDMFIIEGKSEQPVYLWVHNDQVEIRPADHIWGSDTHQTVDTILEETDPKARVACIGPAGERLARIAAIVNDKHRPAARSGVGAVMGAKNLKAIAVRGTRKVLLAEDEKMRDLCHTVQAEVAADANKGSVMREYGTAYVPEVTNELGILPTRNFQTGKFKGVDSITGQELKERYLIRPKSCYRCPVACGRMTRVDDEGYEGKGEGPEYETIATLGSDCGVDNLAAITKANYLCNELGLDTISMGATIACAMELYEKDILPDADSGLPLRFGDADAMVEMVRQTGLREGIGDRLAEGSYRLAKHYGHPEFAMTAKKQELPGYDPRGTKGMGLVYATSNIGASHMAGDVGYAEVFGIPEQVDPLTTEGKPRLVKLFEDVFAVVDAVGLCVFVAVGYLFDADLDLLPTRLTQIMNYATGAGYTPQTLLEAGERIYNLERLFLLKAGFTSADDTLPARMLEEPLPDGPGRGHIVELDKMLPEFYRLRGWDEDGVPTPTTLKALRLDT